MRKKLFTFLLALATSVGMMWAQGPWTSGDCTLTLDGGVMTVSGNGAMADYNKSNPWTSYNSSITSIVIENGVTHVGNGTFPQCTSLVSVVIGDDVETIGEFSFDDAGASLTSVTMGNKVKSIGMAAFLWDTGLPELILSEDLETIGAYAFCRMEALTTITIPSKVTSIGDAAFSNCSALQSIYIEAATPPTLGDGVFANVNADLSTIPLYVPNGSVAAYTAADQWKDFDIQGYDPAPGGGSTPSNVCGGGLTWELSDGVLTISYDGEGTGEMNDFDYEYDDSPVNVAPWKENKSAITTVIVGDGVKSIGNHAFNDLSENFTAVTIANSVERIGLNAFLNSEEITEITLPSSLKTIDEQGFANCGFTSITIPSGVTSIGYKAFCYCRDLTSLTCEATTPPTLASSVFYKIRSSTSSLSSIPLYVPSGSVTAYEAAAQWNDFDIRGYDPTPANSCGGGLTWELSDGVLTISYDGEGTGAMDDFIYFEDPAPWDSSKESITSVIIPDGVTRIGNYAFAGCTSLTTVTIPNSVTSIGYSAFYNCSSLTSVTIPNSVTSIEIGVFSGCSSLTSVTIGNSVTSIGDYAFLRCTGLTSITIPNSVTSIGEGAFAKCSNLETVTILAESLESYGTNAFDGTAATLTIYVPAGSVDTYKAAWTDYADKIEAIPAPEPAVPEWVRDGDEWDADTKTLTVNSSPGVSAYASQSEIEHLIVGDDVISVGNYAFQYCSNLASVTFGSSIVQVCNYSFDGTALTSVEMPDNIRRIGYMAFNDCVDLVTVTVGTGMTNIDGCAFQNCSNLVSLTCKAVTPPNLSNGAFTGASSLAHIYVPAESVDAYKGANKWKDYASIIEAIPGGDDPEPVAEYAEIIFIEPVAADDLAENATFGILGTEFSATISDSGNKMSIDANKCRFGGNEDYKMYEYRLKSGGASSSEKNFITLNIPAAGKIRIAARSSKSDATDRALVIEQGGTELYNAVVMDAQAIEVTEGETTIKVFPYVEVSVTAGSVRVSYTAGMNFYSFGFMEVSTPTDVESVESQKSKVESVKVIRDGQLLIIRDGKTYTLTGQTVK